MLYLLIDFINGTDFGFTNIDDVREFVVDTWLESLEKGAIPRDCSCQEFYESNYTLYYQVEELSF